jgi:hypothetical protein
MTMAGSITVTLTKKQSVWDGLRGFIECKIDWVTQAAGAGEGTLTSAAIVTTAQYNSYLAGRECIMAVTVPGAVNPTAAYDITVTDAYGTDVFGGELMNRSASANEQAIPIFGTHKTSRICAGPWAFNLSGNAVPSALGSCILYFR